MTVVTIGLPDCATTLLLPPHCMPLIAQFAAPMLRSTIDAATLADLLTRAHRINGMDEHQPTAVLLPTGGMGHFQWPAIAGHRDGRAFVLQFGDWQVDQPAPAEATLTAEDPLAELTLSIRIAVTASRVTTLAATLTNRGATPFTLDRMMAASIPLDDADEVVTPDGMWGKEFQLRAEPLGSALWLKESRRGRTSHDRFPAVVLGRRGLLDGDRACLGAHLGASGNHLIAIDRLDDGRRLLHLGELFEPGEIRLAPGVAYATPTAHVARAASLDDLSARFHAHVRDHVLSWPGGSMRPRPVMLNTWEGNYFRHDVAVLKAQATAAAELGIERFVLDDGWFGRRDDDTTSLGDWTVDRRKYPNGLNELVDHVVGLGMEFGLWFEPEMVNPVSDLYRAHPDWVLQIAGRPLMLSRHQLVLDLSRPEVSDHLFGQIDAILAAHAIGYVKWDMNRDLTHVGGADGRAATAAQTRAVWALFDRVRAAHPHVEIESCASGGGRADYGVLSRTHRVWTSDCTDALERQEIQRGAGLFLPPEILGQHVAAAPNHQTGRRLGLAFRAITALTGHLGVELNPLEMTGPERTELAGYIALHKTLRPLLHGRGRCFRQPPRNGRHVYGVIAPDRTEAVVIIAQVAQTPGEQPAPVRLPGLAPDTVYRLALPAPQEPRFANRTAGQAALLAGEILLAGDWLAGIGIPVPDMPPETALLIHITRVDAPPQETARHG